MTDAEWKPMTDWSGLPDVYVTKAECQQGMFWRIEACSVPMAIGPEVRLVPAHKLTGALARAEKAEQERDANAIALRIANQHLTSVAASRDIAWAKAEKAEAERDAALTRLAAAEGRVAALTEALEAISVFVDFRGFNEMEPTTAAKIARAALATVTPPADTTEGRT